jgi:hypothetical protein
MTRKTFLQTLGQDLKFGFRTMRKNLSFSVALVLTIGLGIGANTTMFSTIRAVLLKALDYRDPERLVLFSDGATLGRAEQIAAGSRLYDEIGTYAGGVEDLALSGAGEAEALKGARAQLRCRGRSSRRSSNRHD